MRLAGVLLLGLVACVRIGAYTCDDDAACTARAGGRCEATGHCSYPDDACASGARYSDHAGALAGECTSVDASSSSTTIAETSSSSSSSSTSESSSSSSTTDMPPQPGEVLWQSFYDGGDADKLHAVGLLADGAIVAAGSQVIAEQGEDALLVWFEPNGEARMHVTRDFAGDLDTLQDVVASSNGPIYATGQRAQSLGAYESWTNCFDASSGDDCLDAPTPGVTGRGLDFGVDGLIVTVGATSFGGGAFVVANYDYPAASAWSWTLADGELDDTITIGTTKYVAGARAGRFYLATADAMGIVELATPTGPAEGPDRIQQLARGDDALFAAGYVATLTSRDGWLARFELDDTVAWEHSVGDADLDEEIEGVVVGGSGTIYAVGFTTALDSDSWVLALDPSGEPLWSRNDYMIGDGEDIARDVTLTDDGTLIVVGEAIVGGNYDGFVLALATAE
ncbi:MAG TPA: hypothetical protein VG755_37990 [Nannocystaceae bacterium]|nr:hypothetical protein [Nannocystaceae bacterium]